IVGEADSPSLPPAYLEATFGLLSQPGTGIVLGPCTDGGYYLVAAAGLDPAMARALFEEPAYDGATICQATAERARQLGLWVEFAPEWYDVDTVEDLRRLQAELAQPDDPRLASLSKLLDMLGLDSLHATR
ncbi:MAG TPA: DUF2064 domain-containing protein, partial [Chloroflexota bacterium]